MAPTRGRGRRSIFRRLRRQRRRCGDSPCGVVRTGTVVDRRRPDRKRRGDRFAARDRRGLRQRTAELHGYDHQRRLAFAERPRLFGRRAAAARDGRQRREPAVLLLQGQRLGAKPHSDFHDRFRRRFGTLRLRADAAGAQCDRQSLRHAETVARAACRQGGDRLYLCGPLCQDEPENRAQLLALLRQETARGALGGLSAARFVHRIAAKHGRPIRRFRSSTSLHSGWAVIRTATSTIAVTRFRRKTARPSRR